MEEPTGARQAAEQAAEAIRALNHLTMAPPGTGSPGWEDLADVYAIVGELQVFAQRLPQAFDQLARVLDDTGVVYGTDDDSDPADVLLTAGAMLLGARGEAVDLARSLERAHGAISHLYVERHLDDIAADRVGE